MSILGALLGTDAKDAANKAAADTYAKQQQAISGLQTYGAQLPGFYRDISNAYTPYTAAGGSALQRLQEGLGLSGNSGDFTQAYQSLPGYQSGLNTGLTSAQRALNSGGISQSGSAMKQLYRYGSDYENQRAGDYLTRLGGLANSGLSATGQQVGTQAAGLGAQTGVNTAAFGGQLQAAPTIGQGMVAGAQAQQNALGNLLGAGAYLGGKIAGNGLFGSFGGGGGGGGGYGSSPVSAGSYGGIPYPIFG